MDRYQAAALAMIVAGLVITAVSLAGEVLGWWNDVGELGTVLGVALTAIGLAVAILLGATKTDVCSLSGKLDQANGKLDQANEKLGQLDRIAALLEEIRDRLPTRG